MSADPGAGASIAAATELNVPYCDSHTARSRGFTLPVATTSHAEVLSSQQLSERTMDLVGFNLNLLGSVEFTRLCYAMFA